MKDMHTFSIIMPAYNQADHLEEAVSSVIGQSFSDWELIIVNDGSTDNTPEIIEAFSRQDSRIRAFHQTNRGVSSARNHAIAMAKAPWLCYLDSDDIWFKDTLKSYNDYIEKNNQAKFIYGYRHRLRDGKITRQKGKHQKIPGGLKELFQESFLSPIRVCHLRELVEIIGGFDENLPNTGSEDYDFFLRMSLHVKFEPIGVATGLRRRHGKNITEETGYSKMIEAAVLLRFIEQYDCRSLISVQDVNRRLGRAFYKAGREYFKGRFYRQCVEAITMGQPYKMTFKGQMLKQISRLLFPFSLHDKNPSPFPLAPYCTGIQDSELSNLAKNS